MNVPSGQLDQLTAEQKRQLLAELLKNRPAQPKDRSLSVGQERLYSLVQLTPSVPLYNVAVAYRLAGSLDIGSLEQAVRRIAERHEILRTTFPRVDGKPIQRIAPQTTSETFSLVDLGTIPQIDRAAKANEIVESEIERVIDIAKGPLWRTAILCVSEREHILVLTMHHIVSDGWSFDLFLKELSALYDEFAGVSINQPVKLAIQYCDFAARQRESFSGSEFESQRRYWASQLSGPIQPLRLPGEHSKPDEDDRGAASLPFSLSNELSQSLLNLGRQQNATLFMTLLVGFGALLHGSTYQEDLLLCTPVTGRHRPQSKDLIGYFNNILPMRLNLSGNPSLLDLLGRTKRVALDAFNNQDVPFHWNANLPALRRISLSRLLFSLDMEWPPRLQLTGVTCEAIPIDTGAADFDLSVSLWTRDGRIFGNLRYKRKLFEETRISELIETYRSILTVLATEPQRTLASLQQRASDGAQDQRPAASIQDHGADEPLSILPRSAIELRLVQEWEDELDQRPIGIHDDLQALGASSLTVASLAVRIQNAFGTSVPITEIFQAGTVAKMATLLQSRDKSLTSSPLAPIQRHGTKPALFLCEGVGIYFPLVPYLGDDRPVYGLVTEILEDFPDVVSLASHYVRVVLETQPNGPYNIGGVSFGGLVAFEMAQQLQALGRKVGLLALMDTPGPEAYRLKPPLRRAIGHIKNTARYGYPYLRTKMKNRLTGLSQKLAKPKHSNESSASRLIADVETLRGIFEQRATNYRPKPYQGRITLFMLSQRSAMSDSLFDPELGDVSPSLGWESVARGGLDRYELNGEHVSILKEPFVRDLGERLRECLNHQDLGE